MSTRLRIVLIAGCAVLAVLHGGRTGAVLAQGLGGPYREAVPAAPVEDPRAEPARGPWVGQAATSRASDVALRELAPFLEGQGRGL